MNAKMGAMYMVFDGMEYQAINLNESSFVLIVGHPLPAPKAQIGLESRAVLRRLDIKAKGME